jgi:hypothetical protein
LDHAGMLNGIKDVRYKWRGKKCQFGPVRLYYNSCYSRISSESHSEKLTVWYNVTNDLYTTYIYIRLLFVESDQQNRSESFFVRCI